MDYKPGDLIFYPDDGALGHHLFALLQRWFGEMGSVKVGDREMTHVAMISTEPDLIVEMRWPQPRFRFFADDTREKIIMRPKLDEKTKMRAVYWCYLNVDTHYSFWQMLLGRFGICQTWKVCSGWVDTAYRESGVCLTDENDKLVSPNELYSSDKLERV
jgi:hypothetical protein